METKVLTPSKETYSLAKEILLNEDVVGFPTETVYGLGAIATSDKAVKKIYEVKGRPQDNPLIVHVHENYDLSKLIIVEYDYVKKLQKAFLPGPLTMVYKSLGNVSSVVSCGLDTLAIRVPRHNVAREFLKYVDMPIAAPSANISKHTSPVTAKHVYDDFNGKIKLIIDGGKSDGGIESTVLDVTGPTPVVLRAGIVTYSDIKEVVGKCEYVDKNSMGKVRSPGMKYSHYMPKCETARFERKNYKLAQKLYDEYVLMGKKPYFMCDLEMAKLVNGNILSLGGSGEEIASNLYDKLHEGELVADLIIAFDIDTGNDIDVGINNRQSKACQKRD